MGMARGFGAFVVELLVCSLIFFFLADLLCFFIAMTLPLGITVQSKALVELNSTILTYRTGCLL